MAKHLIGYLQPFFLIIDGYAVSRISHFRRLAVMREQLRHSLFRHFRPFAVKQVTVLYGIVKEFATCIADLVVMVDDGKLILAVIAYITPVDDVKAVFLQFVDVIQILEFVCIELLAYPFETRLQVCVSADMRLDGVYLRAKLLLPFAEKDVSVVVFGRIAERLHDGTVLPCIAVLILLKELFIFHVYCFLGFPPRVCSCSLLTAACVCRRSSQTFL